MSENKPNWKEMVLTISPVVRTVFDENGLATLIVPRFKNKILIKLLVNEKRKNEIKIDLDELGTAVWNLIDGKRDIQNIVDDLRKTHPNQEQLEERTVQFLVGLYKRLVVY